MSQGVAVGFSPAVTPVVTSGTAAPAQGDAAGGSLFATLLALLGGSAAGEADAILPAGAPNVAQPDASAVSPALLFDMAKAVPEVDASVVPASEPATTEEGRGLLKTLGDALIALNDAADAGQPPDPALEKKLDDALDAVAAYLGIALPANPQLAPVIAAEASGAGALPGVLAPAPTAPTTSGDAAVPAPASAGTPGGVDPTDGGGELEAAESGSKASFLPLSENDPPVVAASAPETPATPTAVDNTELPATEVTETRPAAEVAAGAPETEVETSTSATAKPVAEVVPTPIAKLAKLLDGLADKVEEQSPELAKKLEALADQLKAGKLPDAVAAALAGDGESPEPQLARIIEALSAPKQTTTAAAASVAQPFVAPSLPLPEPLAQAKAEEKPAAAEKPDDVAEAEDRSTPSIKLAQDADPKPQASEHKPAVSAAAGAVKPDATPTPQSDQPATSSPMATATAPTASRAVHAAYQTPVQQVNLPQVAFEVVRQFQAGNTRFQIRLDPPELGRIDVKLDVDKSGAVNARMTVERPETLDLMQRDQRALQQALQQAGLDSSKTSLEFSLRQNPFAQQQGMGDGRGQQASYLPANGGAATGDESVEVQPSTNIYRGTATAGGVNLIA